jgi:hypothetical protein
MRASLPRRPIRLALTAVLTTLVGLVALLVAPPPASAAGEWQDGTSDSDTIIDCWLQKPVTGVSANAGWWSPTGQVPRVGETFYVRGYAGLVGLPCSQSGVAVLPELVLPPGVEFAPGAFQWDVQAYGEAPDMRERPFTYQDTVDGAVLIGDENGQPFTLRQGWVFEFRFPVRATRELKGPATPAPECQQRRDGHGPCPAAQSGDHFQVAFTVAGHGGDKQYVTPYVPLFATAAPGAPAAGGHPVAEQAEAASTTSLSVRRRTATVAVSPAATGAVVLLDRGKPVARARLVGSAVRFRLTRLTRGKHRLVATFLGSASVAGSSSPPRTVRLR